MTTLRSALVLIVLVAACGNSVQPASIGLPSPLRITGDEAFKASWAASVSNAGVYSVTTVARNTEIPTARIEGGGCSMAVRLYTDADLTSQSIYSSQRPGTACPAFAYYRDIAAGDSAILPAFSVSTYDMRPLGPTGQYYAAAILAPAGVPLFLPLGSISIQ